MLYFRKQSAYMYKAETTVASAVIKNQKSAVKYPKTWVKLVWFVKFNCSVSFLKYPVMNCREILKF